MFNLSDFEGKLQTSYAEVQDFLEDDYSSVEPKKLVKDAINFFSDTLSMCGTVPYKKELHDVVFHKMGNLADIIYCECHDYTRDVEVADEVINRFLFSATKFAKQQEANKPEMVLTLVEKVVYLIFDYLIENLMVFKIHEAMRQLPISEKDINESEIRLVKHYKEAVGMPGGMLYADLHEQLYKIFKGKESTQKESIKSLKILIEEIFENRGNSCNLLDNLSFYISDLRLMWGLKEANSFVSELQRKNNCIYKSGSIINIKSRRNFQFGSVPFVQPSRQKDLNKEVYNNIVSGYLKKLKKQKVVGCDVLGKKINFKVIKNRGVRGTETGVCLLNALKPKNGNFGDNFKVEFLTCLRDAVAKCARSRNILGKEIGNHIAGNPKSKWFPKLIEINRNIHKLEGKLALQLKRFNEGMGLVSDEETYGKNSLNEYLRKNSKVPSGFNRQEFLANYAEQQKQERILFNGFPARENGLLYLNMLAKQNWFGKACAKVYAMRNNIYIRIWEKNKKGVFLIDPEYSHKPGIDVPPIDIKYDGIHFERLEIIKNNKEHKIEDEESIDSPLKEEGGHSNWWGSASLEEEDESLDSEFSSMFGGGDEGFSKMNIKKSSSVQKDVRLLVDKPPPVIPKKSLKKKKSKKDKQPDSSRQNRFFEDNRTGEKRKRDDRKLDPDLDVDISSEKKPNNEDKRRKIGGNDDDNFCLKK